MSYFAWRSLVLSSVLILAASARPRYGGTLRIQTLEISDFETSPLVVETLVRVDDRGDFQPMLARAWQRDAEGKRWRFTLRPKIQMHDGTMLTPAIAASMLGPAASVVGQQILIQSDTPAPDMLEQLVSKPLFRRCPDGSICGTGPFRLAKLDAGKHATLSAFEQYWGGRPFLDTLEIATTRNMTADAFELPVTASRRSVPERYRLWTSPPQDLIALIVPDSLREVFALTIDRDAIANVITQRRGEPARGILPEWLTGYAAVLPFAYDVARAKQLAQSARVTITAPTDPLLRLIADRIALNARDSGVIVTIAPQNGTARLIRFHLPSNNAAQSLTQFARIANLPDPSPGASLQSSYEAERNLLSDHGIVPIVFIPSVYALDPRVKDWDPLHLENVWIDR